MSQDGASRGRWAILRRAFQEAVAAPPAEDAAAEYTIHRHEGFSALLEKHCVPWRPRLLVPAAIADELEASDVDLLVQGDSREAREGLRLLYRTKSGAVTAWTVGERTHHPDFERIDYVLPDEAGTLVSARQRRSKPTLQEIFSHREHDGVDNTGNVRVWAAEEVLAFAAVQEPLRALFAGKRVLELGAGMAGVAGLAIAASCAPASVHITDGNPTAVEGLAASAALNTFPEGVVVHTERMLWGAPAAEAPHARVFDVVVACDTLFFEDFHGELIATLGAVLAPDGVALLLQPRRGGSLERFVERAQGVLMVELDEEVHPAVAAMHAQFESSSEYDADIHRPILLRCRRSSVPSC